MCDFNIDDIDNNKPCSENVRKKRFQQFFLQLDKRKKRKNSNSKLPSSSMSMMSSNYQRKQKQQDNINFKTALISLDHKIGGTLKEIVKNGKQNDDANIPKLKSIAV